MGDTLWKLVTRAFQTGVVEEKLMEILIVLIPKIDHPSSVKELRPISLFNVTYKLITKVLVNRLRPFLNNLICPMQSSFLPNRGTTDNALVAHEVIHHMSMSSAKQGSIAFKIDIEKAYDNIS